MAEPMADQGFSILNSSYPAWSKNMRKRTNVIYVCTSKWSFNPLTGGGFWLGMESLVKEPKRFVRGAEYDVLQSIQEPSFFGELCALQRRVLEKLLSRQSEDSDEQAILDGWRSLWATEIDTPFQEDCQSDLRFCDGEDVRTWVNFIKENIPLLAEHIAEWANSRLQLTGCAGS